MIDLARRHCAPCHGGVAALSPEGRSALQAEVPEWAVRPDGGELSRTFRFADWSQTMAFVNAVAWVAHVEDHHPDLEVHYNHVVVRWSTHAVGGLTENDFICAARVDALLPG